MNFVGVVLINVKDHSQVGNATITTLPQACSSVITMSFIYCWLTEKLNKCNHPHKDAISHGRQWFMHWQWQQQLWQQPNQVQISHFKSKTVLYKLQEEPQLSCHSTPALKPVCHMNDKNDHNWSAVYHMMHTNLNSVMHGDKSETRMTASIRKQNPTT